jgi:OPA family glycerol-3-phosphate transporter-like MFS transporter 1/2
MANWYGKGKRGLVMGIWNAHTSLGNIMGTVIAAACLQYGWGYAFIVPGVLISLLGLVVFAVLVVQPSDVGLGGSYEPVKSAEAVSFIMGNCDSSCGSWGRAEQNRRQ